MREVLLVAAGGAAGATLRYAVNLAMISRTASEFPWHTLVVNVVGAFLLGVLAALTLERGLLPTQYALLLGTGLLGGFTTFSAFAYESVVLIERGQAALGVANILASCVLGVSAAVAGLLVGRAI